MFCKLCGGAAFGNVALVTNMWGEVSRNIGEAREYELLSDLFELVIREGAQMIRHHNTVESAHNVIRRIVAARPVVLEIQRELIDERKNIAITTAGQVIKRELEGQLKQHLAGAVKVLEGMVRALRGEDEKTLGELNEEGERLLGRIMETVGDSERISAEPDEEVRRELGREIRKLLRLVEEKRRLVYEIAKNGGNPQITSHVTSCVQAPFHLTINGS